MARSTTADRLKMQLNKHSGLKNLSKIVQDHGFVDGSAYSYKDHEYQIEILNDDHQRVGIQKCSQVGASELAIQKALATCVSWPNMRMIYTLPTERFANTFSKDRIDGAIDSSEHYSGLTTDQSAGYKKIGSSSLYVVGTYGSKSAISIPAEFLVQDELDFSNQVVIGQMESRIRHAKTEDEFDNRGFRTRFSTPTVHGYGINIDFEAGDQRHYMCRCQHCDKWTLPDFKHDFIIPGYDGDIMKFGRLDLNDPRYDPGSAWIRCSHCHKDLTNSLLDPERRMWVAKRPDVREFRSYQVSPWDVPKYNSPPAIIKQLSGYPARSDFMNFVIGVPHSDNENSFNTTAEHMDRLCTLDTWVAGMVLAGELFGGSDVGVKCHFNVRLRIGSRSLVVHMEVIENSKKNPGYTKLIERYDSMGLTKLCLDNGPDITLVNMLVNARDGIHSVVYSNVSGLVPAVLKADGMMVNADRTKTLRLTMEAHNMGEISYPRQQDLKDTLTKHLGSTKKIKETDGLGGFNEKFIKIHQEDHWVHSLNYSQIAMLLCEYTTSSDGASALPGVTTTRMGGNSQAQNRQDHLVGMFGIGTSKGSRRR